MQKHDPRFLRQLASTYRTRAISEPSKARVFLDIAKDMEMHARLIEDKVIANAVERCARPNGSRSSRAHPLRFYPKLLIQQGPKVGDFRNFLAIGRSYQMTNTRDIVALALLTREDVSRLGTSFRLVFKADHSSSFEDLIKALDRAEHEASGRGRPNADG